jgi:hypothetical protein
MPAEHVMHLIHELERELAVARLARRPVEPEEIADGECVGPEVALRRSRRAEAGAVGEAMHQVDGLVGVRWHRGEDARAGSRAQAPTMRRTIAARPV